jgi:quercetin dioxygenase-like cupin family protein
MGFRRALFLALVALVATTGVVYAAFTVTPLANGIAPEGDMRDFVKAVKETRQIDTTQMRILDVTLTDAAGTGWHTHPGTPSLIVVKSGQINYLTPDGAGGCTTRTLNPGEMIFHPSSLHDLRPVGSSAVFTAVYFSSPGVILTNPTSGPC